MFSSSQEDATIERLYYEKTTNQAESSPLESFMRHLESGDSSNNNQFFAAMNHKHQNQQLQPRALLGDVDDAPATCSATRQNNHRQDDAASMLQQFDQELASAAATTSTNTTMAFQLAQKIAPALVGDASFRTMFLRASPNDPQRAAQRMLQFFQHKLQLFGVDRLGKNIAMSDLSDEDRNVLYRGRMQVLKERDQSGKTVLCTIVENGEAIANRDSIVSEASFLFGTTLIIFSHFLRYFPVPISSESCTT